jgi:hypothetical protein
MEQLSLPGGKFRPRKPPPPPLERRTHIALADLLRLDLGPGWWWTHIASEAERSDGGRRLQARMGLKTGLPDFWLIDPEGRSYFLELKRGRLGMLSAGQIEFGIMCGERGLPYAVARSYEEAVAQFQAWEALGGRVR